VTLEEVLKRQGLPEANQDKIVMIGYTDKTDRNTDDWNTPYGEVPGVVLQAQMASQIISHVLDGRPLLWWWPFLGETLWTLVWGMVGGAVFWWFARPKRLAIAAMISLLSLYGICTCSSPEQGAGFPLSPPSLPGWWPVLASPSLTIVSVSSKNQQKGGI